MEVTRGYGPDVITEAVGSEPTYQMAISRIQNCGSGETLS